MLLLDLDPTAIKAHQNKQLPQNTRLTALLVLANALLKEVGLALQADDLHPVEGVLGEEVLLTTQRHQEPSGEQGGEDRSGQSFSALLECNRDSQASTGKAEQEMRETSHNPS